MWWLADPPAQAGDQGMYVDQAGVPNAVISSAHSEWLAGESRELRSQLERLDQEVRRRETENADLIARLGEHPKVFAAKLHLEKAAAGAELDRTRTHLAGEIERLSTELELSQQWIARLREDKKTLLRQVDQSQSRQQDTAAAADRAVERHCEEVKLITSQADLAVQQGIARASEIRSLKAALKKQSQVHDHQLNHLHQVFRERSIAVDRQRQIELEKLVSAEQESREQLSQCREDMKRLNEELSQRKLSHDGELAELRFRHQVELGRLTTALAVSERLASERNELERLHDAAIAEVEKLQRDADGSDAERDELRAAVDDLKEQLRRQSDQHEQKCIDLRRESEQRHQQSQQEHLATIESLQSANDQLNEALAEHVAHQRETESEVFQLRDDRTQQTERLDDALRSKAEIESEVVQLREHLNRQTERLDESIRSKAEFESELAMLRENEARQTERLSETLRSKAEIESEIGQLRAYGNQQTDRLAEALRSKAEVESARQTDQLTIESLTRVNQELQSIRAESDEARAQVRRTEEGYGLQREVLQQENLRSHSDLIEQRQTVASLVARARELQQTLSEATGQNAKLTELVSSCESERQSNRRQLESLRKEGDLQSAMIRQLERGSRCCQDENDELTTKLNEAQNAQKRLEESSATIAAERRADQGQMRNLSVQIDRLRNQADKSEADRIAITRNLDSLREKLVCAAKIRQTLELKWSRSEKANRELNLRLTGSKNRVRESAAHIVQLENQRKRADERECRLNNTIERLKRERDQLRGSFVESVSAGLIMRSHTDRQERRLIAESKRGSRMEGAQAELERLRSVLHAERQTAAKAKEAERHAAEESRRRKADQSRASEAIKAAQTSERSAWESEQIAKGELSSLRLVHAQFLQGTSETVGQLKDRIFELEQAGEERLQTASEMQARYSELERDSAQRDRIYTAEIATLAQLASDADAKRLNAESSLQAALHERAQIQAMSTRAERDRQQLLGMQCRLRQQFQGQLNSESNRVEVAEKRLEQTVRTLEEVRADRAKSERDQKQLFEENAKLTQTRDLLRRQLVVLSQRQPVQREANGADDSELHDRLVETQKQLDRCESEIETLRNELARVTRLTGSQRMEIEQLERRTESLNSSLCEQRQEIGSAERETAQWERTVASLEHESSQLTARLRREASIRRKVQSTLRRYVADSDRPDLVAKEVAKIRASEEVERLQRRINALEKVRLVERRAAEAKLDRYRTAVNELQLRVEDRRAA